MNRAKAAGVPALLLLGLSRSGKTTVGEVLAARLSCPFYDTDTYITTQTGMEPRDLYRKMGCAALYRAECTALVSCIDRTRQCGDVCDTRQTAAYGVIATGGGISDNPKAAGVAAAHPNTFFLAADEAVLFERLTADAEKTGCYPAFLGSLPYSEKLAARKNFAVLYARRAEWYAENSCSTIDTTGLSVSDIADKIVSLLQV